MKLQEVVKRPLVTEKHMHFAEKRRQYAFEVSRSSNKSEIKSAVELLFNVKVKAVNTMIVPGKLKRRKQNLHRSPDWKKAVVTLREGYSIDLV